MLYTQFTNSVTFRYLVLALGLIVMLFIKIPNLSIPFFWDESWVYGPAVCEMGRTLPSLLPGSIDIDLSRGHPMLFHFLGGLWGNIFGVSVASLHVFALLISLTFLAVFYKVATKYAPKYSFLATILLAFQGLFLAQSAMVLPEVLVGLFVLLSINSFVHHKHNYAILFACLCLMTKESGAMLFPALGLSFLFHSLLTSNFSWKKSFLFLGKLILGLVPYIAFLLIQKARFGWFFFPNHLDLQIDTSRLFQLQFVAILKYTFFTQGRILITLAATIAYILNFKKNRLALTLLGVSLFYIFILLIYPMMTWSVLILFAFVCLLSFIPFVKEIKKQYAPSLHKHFTIVTFVLLYLVFTGMNFLSSRYLLCIFPFFIILSAVSIEKLKRQYVVHIIYGVLIAVCLTHAMRRAPVSDVNQSYIEVGQAQKALIGYLEDKELYDATFMAPFLVQESLKKLDAGHRSNLRPFTSVPYFPNPKESFYNIISSFEGEYTNDGHKVGRTKIHVKTFSSGKTSFILEKYSPVTE